MNKIRIGTRSSKLAMWQANFIASQLRKQYPSINVELVNVTTKGDKILEAPLSKIGGKGLFTKELEVQMLNKNIDLAVHSLKDVPVELADDFSLAAITKRYEPFDAFVSNKYNSFNELPPNAKIGTSSLRRRAQLLNIRPDLTIVDLRGNVDTRIKKLDAGEFDAIILAAAGLKRLGYDNRITEIMPTSLMLPAVGQGALAIEVLKNNDDLCELLQFLDDAETRAAVSAERAFLKVVEGGCQVPVGVYAVVVDGRVSVEAIIASIDGKNIVRDKITGTVDFAEQLGSELANKLLNIGGREILTTVLSQ